MKNLSEKYSKIGLQRLFHNIRYSYTNKICYKFSGKNLIGFYSEYYWPEDKDYVCNVNGYDLCVSKINKKLYKKYPSNVTKKEYKEWLKKNYK